MQRFLSGLFLSLLLVTAAQAESTFQYDETSDVGICSVDGSGDIQFITDLAGLNTALGTNIADGPHTVDTDTDTNAGTICAGATTYLNGESTCIDISAVYAPISHTHDAADIVSGVLDDARIPESAVTQHQAALVLDAAQIQSGVLAHERGGLEADVSAYDGLTGITGGATVEISDLADLNVILGSAIADGPHTVDTNSATLCSGTSTYLDGENNCDDLSAIYAALSHNHSASEITSGVLVHERGGLEADVSAYDGIIGITAGATFEVDTLAELNSLLGTSIADGPHTSDTDTNAGTLCAGATTYLNGETGCVNISLVYAAISHNHAASEITSGTLIHERGGLEADVSAYNGLVRISGGATSNVTNLSGLNTALGTTLTDFGSTIGPTELAATDFGDFTCNGTSCTVDTLDWTSDITEGSVTGMASFASGVADTVTTLDAMGEKMTDVADAITASSCDVFSSASGATSWDDNLASVISEGCIGLTDISNVVLTSPNTGEILIDVSGSWINQDLLLWDVDQDTSLSSTSSSTFADIPGLIATLPGATTGREIVHVVAEINVGVAAFAECQFRIVQDADGADTVGLVTAQVDEVSQGSFVGNTTNGTVDVITLNMVFAPPSATTVNYTVEWSEQDAAVSTCYQTQAYISALAFLDE